MWEIEFYERRNGTCPTRNFLNSLDPKTDIPFVKNDLLKLAEFGYKLTRPYVDYLRDDIYELRSKTMRGQIRLFYFFYNHGKIIVTHGMVKKRKNVPPDEIDRAIEYRQDYLDQKEEKRSR